jgi:hypothetical protein
MSSIRDLPYLLTLASVSSRLLFSGSAGVFCGAVVAASRAIALPAPRS